MLLQTKNICLSITKFPRLFLPTNDSVETDKCIDMDLYRCDACGCVQIKQLLDPDELYSTAHNTTSDTPTWQKHHNLLSEFITGISYCENIYEVGGYSGKLAIRVLNKKPEINYTILDICTANPCIQNVKFLTGNCETFQFTRDSSVVMSHVFEHLYNPSKFVKNLARNKVQNVIISIPNMTAQVKNMNIPIINQEHTFFVDYDTITYLFSNEGYSLKNSVHFQEHSIFFHFAYSVQTPTIANSSFFNNETSDNLLYAYDNKRNRISDICLSVSDNIFICPAGAYGQFIYCYLPEIYKPIIKGFLDNDPTKVGKRLYGTPQYIFPMDKVTIYDKVTVILYDGQYANEISQQLSSYTQNITFIRI